MYLFLLLFQAMVFSRRARLRLSFFDATGSFYVFANNQGRFYKVNPNTLAAVVISTPGPAGNNDGASCPNTILPVTFGSIDAFIKNDTLIVNFSSESETNNEHFDMEVSVDGKSFTKIGEVKTKAIDGNTDETIAYKFTGDLKAMGIVAAGAGVLLLGGLGIGFGRRPRVGWIAVALAGIGWGIISCNKSESTLADTATDIYVRIAQVDKDGARSYSKVIKAVNNR
ncbi:hypothetical protein [Niabella hibiscisoli]|uniref:hypothetical protein n=1 Tax=Niabella hibiscisoli TaxID=1825928 RepID=UPI001F104658|nr:hypothetical protein [Niabella hibiscisoli]MCH5721092.1 hypothetical protein [Niabella hibiscisoli]